MAANGSASKTSTANFLVSAWYQSSFWLLLLWPLSLLYRLLTSLRRWFYRLGLLASWKPPVPVIVVGNITVGGTGKTPLVIALVQALQQAGYNPGIVSRGYGSRAPSYPFLVTADKSPEHCGDEPLLMAKRTAVPVVIDANRIAAAKQLVEQHHCDVIISDDGLQHYALQRDIEIVVVDGQRGFANGLLLPAGPLREPVSRLQQVDFIVGNGGDLSLKCGASVHRMQLQPAGFAKLDNDQGLVSEGAQCATPDMIAAADWQQSKQVHAVAGIGNPQRFYQTLRQLGLSPIEHDFIDHHQYVAEDLHFGDTLPVIMTEKDAVKVRSINAPDNCWFVPVTAELEGDCFGKILQRLQALAQVSG